MAESHLRNLSKRWGSFVNIDRPTLTNTNQNHSGCGKTTTMRMIAGRCTADLWATKPLKPHSYQCMTADKTVTMISAHPAVAE